MQCQKEPIPTIEKAQFCLVVVELEGTTASTSLSVIGRVVYNAERAITIDDQVLKKALQMYLLTFSDLSFSAIAAIHRIRVKRFRDSLLRIWSELLTLLRASLGK